MSNILQYAAIASMSVLVLTGTAHAENNATASTTIVGSGSPMQALAAMPTARSTDTSRNVIHDPQQIRSCLCLEATYKSQQGDISTKQAAYSQATSQKASLEAQIEAAKAGPLSPEQTDSIRKSSLQQIELLNRINQDYIPALQTSTSAYNDTVARFQESCGGKAYDSDVLARVKPGLTCQAQ